MNTQTPTGDWLSAFRATLSSSPISQILLCLAFSTPTQEIPWGPELRKLHLSWDPTLVPTLCSGQPPRAPAAPPPPLPLQPHLPARNPAAGRPAQVCSSVLNRDPAGSKARGGGKPVAGRGPRKRRPGRGQDRGGAKAEGGAGIGGGAGASVGCRAFQSSRRGASVSDAGHPLGCGPSLAPSSANTRRYIHQGAGQFEREATNDRGGRLDGGGGARLAASFPRKLNRSQVSCASACTRRIGGELFRCGWSSGARETRR